MYDLRCKMFDVSLMENIIEIKMVFFKKRKKVVLGFLRLV